MLNFQGSRATPTVIKQAAHWGSVSARVDTSSARRPQPWSSLNVLPSPDVRRIEERESIDDCCRHALALTLSWARSRRPGTTASLRLPPSSTGSATSAIPTCFAPSRPTFRSSRPSSSHLWVFQTSNGWIFFLQGNLANKQVLEALSVRTFSLWVGLQKDVSPMCSRRLRRRRWSAHLLDEQPCATLQTLLALLVTTIILGRPPSSAACAAVACAAAQQPISLPNRWLYINGCEFAKAAAE